MLGIKEAKKDESIKQECNKLRGRKRNKLEGCLHPNNKKPMKQRAREQPFTKAKTQI